MTIVMRVLMHPALVTMMMVVMMMTMKTMSWYGYTGRMMNARVKKSDAECGGKNDNEENDRRREGTDLRTFVAVKAGCGRTL